MPNRSGPVPRALAFGVLALALTLFGGGIWTALLVANLATSPAFPWSVPVMALVLWVAWRYLEGTGSPQISRNSPGNLQARPARPCDAPLAAAERSAALQMLRSPAIRGRGRAMSPVTWDRIRVRRCGQRRATTTYHGSGLDGAAASACTSARSPTSTRANPARSNSAATERGLLKPIAGSAARVSAV